jgi:hypothetical protein
MLSLMVHTVTGEHKGLNTGTCKYRCTEKLSICVGHVFRTNVDHVTVYTDRCFTCFPTQTNTTIPALQIVTQ